MGGELPCPAEWLEECLIVRPAGVLDSTTYAVLRDTLLKCAIDQPAAVIVDLAGLAVAVPSVLSVFTAVWLRISDWPAVPILLVADNERTQLLRRSSIQRYVAIHPSVRDALDNIDKPPLRKRSRLTLRHNLASPRAARRFVEQTCASWQISPGVASDAVQIASELIQNTVEHTLSDAQLRLELGRGLLTVAVSDRSPAPAVLADPGSDPGNAGRGLHLVAQLTKTWGCAVDPVSGGKTVWAVLKDPKLIAR